VATADSLYALSNELCAVFDAACGELKATWPIPPEAKPKEKDVWRHIALQGDTLLGVAGPSPTFRPMWYAPSKRGTATAAFALDRATGKCLWAAPCDALASSFAVGNGKLFFFDSGRSLHGIDVKDAGARRLPPPRGTSSAGVGYTTRTQRPR
jgi:hypothetical protein